MVRYPTSCVNARHKPPPHQAWASISLPLRLPFAPCHAPSVVTPPGWDKVYTTKGEAGCTALCPCVRRRRILQALCPSAVFVGSPATTAPPGSPPRSVAARHQLLRPRNRTRARSTKVLLASPGLVANYNFPHSPAASFDLSDTCRCLVIGTPEPASISHPRLLDTAASHLSSLPYFEPLEPLEPNPSRTRHQCRLCTCRPTRVTSSSTSHLPPGPSPSRLPVSPTTTGGHGEPTVLFEAGQAWQRCHRPIHH